MIVFQNLKDKIQSTIWRFFWQNFQLPEVSIEEVVPAYANFEPRISEYICLPPYVGNEEYRDYPILISLIKQTKPTRILELGTAYGNTVANLCLESDADVFTVNALPDQMEGSIITYTLNQDEIGTVYKEHGFENRVTQIFENTKRLKILDYFQEKSVEFVFIDACHDAEFVVSDFLTILPALTDNAVVVFHDTHPSGEKHLLDSYVGCMFLRKMGFNVNHIVGSSLGYWTANEPTSKSPWCMKIKNLFHSLLGFFVYGKKEKQIMGIRWLGSKFLKRGLEEIRN